MKSGKFDGLEFFQHSNSEALAIKIVPGEGCSDTALFEDKNGSITILCENVDSMKFVRGALLYAIEVLDKHINN